MDNLARQAFWNAALLVEKLEPGETITREKLIKQLRRPLPPIAERQSDATISHAYRHYILNAGVSRAYDVITYDEAADLAGKSIAAIRQAAYRGALIKTTQYWAGRERTGVYFKSLADWCDWPPDRFQDAEKELEKLRKLNTDEVVV